MNLRWQLNLFPPRIELGTFCVLGRRDNRYTTETLSLNGYLFNTFNLPTFSTQRTAPIQA